MALAARAIAPNRVAKLDLRRIFFAFFPVSWSVAALARSPTQQSPSSKLTCDASGGLSRPFGWFFRFWEWHSWFERETSGAC